MPLLEYEIMVSNAKMRESIINERTILEVSTWNRGEGTETITYVSVNKDKLFSKLQTSLKQLESREESYGKQIKDWNEVYSKMQVKVDNLERHKRMSERANEDYRVLGEKYVEVKRELDELRSERVGGFRRFLPPFLRR
jgi:DNA repair ATPase RecN